MKRLDVASRILASLASHPSNTMQEYAAYKNKHQHDHDFKSKDQWMVARSLELADLLISRDAS